MPRPLSAKKKLEWEEKIRQQRESGLSIERWCKQNTIAPHVFHYWKTRLFPKHPLTRSCFTELKTAPKTGISIEYRGIRIHLDKCFDSTTLKSCLLALKGIPC
jgi:hypothetical protein